MRATRTKTTSRSPAGELRTAEEVAAILAVPVSRVIYHCEQAGRAGAASFFCGAYKDREGWIIPERALRRALGAIVHQHYSLAELAQLTGFSTSFLRRRLVIVPAGQDVERHRQPHQLAARLFFGTDLRVSGMELDRLAAGLVTSAPREEAAAA